MSKDNWDQYQTHVLFELERLNDNVSKIDKDVNKIHIEIAMLKVKSSIWGAGFGAIFGVVSILISNYLAK